MGADSSHPSASFVSVTHSATAACIKPLNFASAVRSEHEVSTSTAGVTFETCPAYSSHVAEMFAEAKPNVFSVPYSLKTAGRQNNP